jgi:hypothetical protein
MCMLYSRQEEGSMLYTPLHEAAWCNQLSSAKTLVSLGASVLAKDKWGKVNFFLKKNLSCRPLKRLSLSGPHERQVGKGSLSSSLQPTHPPTHPSFLPPPSPPPSLPPYLPPSPFLFLSVCLCLSLFLSLSPCLSLSPPRPPPPLTSLSLASVLAADSCCTVEPPKTNFCIWSPQS